MLIGVKNFKCIRDVELDLSTVNAFIGSPGAGKSTLFDALQYFGTEGPFPNLHLTTEGCSISYNAQGARAVSGTVPEELMQYRVYRPEVSALRTRCPILGPRGEGLEQAVIEVLQQNPKEAKRFMGLLDFADSFFCEASPSGSHLRMQDRAGIPLSVDEMSTGTLMTLFIMVLCLHPRIPKMFAVENIDMGINPRLLQRLIGDMTTRFINREDSCLLLGVQNPVVLDALPFVPNPLRLHDRSRLFALDRTFGGETAIRSVTLSPARTSPMASQQWMRGWIGAM